MKYYLDTEFHEYEKQPKVLGVNVGKPIDTIELISIGIVAEDGREYYAICNEFDLKAAWNDEWLRENVLKCIYRDFGGYEQGGIDYYQMKSLLKCEGKTREQIAEEIISFTLPNESIGMENYDGMVVSGRDVREIKPEFYAYYADYDWVVFCWLFGRMIDLPKGFPMYCRDLKQELDEGIIHSWMSTLRHRSGRYFSKDEALTYMEAHSEYPKHEDEHNALADAKWNKELHEFITNVKL